jgi:hypothetical protein
MNPWSRRRKRIILSLIIFVLVVLIGAPLFFLFYKTPTCNDLKQNGDETGVDCGGSCQLLCTEQSLALILKGDPRILKVTDNVYELVMLAENPNTNGEIYRAGYIFKLYDSSSSVPLKVVEGETFVPKGSTFAIFEGPFGLENGVNPTRVTFEWKKGGLLWRTNPVRIPELGIKDVLLSREETNPRLDALVENTSLESVANIDLVALVYNESGSIFAASKTYIDVLPAGGRIPVVFSWPEPFIDNVFNTDIIIRILPDKSFIR